eukprot:jgi/Botrbrau1/18480/Bobra.0072s0062.2
MYNGIGLLTPRGSGTSGYVQTNKFNLRVQPQLSIEERDSIRAPKQRKPNVDIIEHNRKRDIELKVEEMRVLLEDQGYSPEEVETMLRETREELIAAAALAAEINNERAGQETHELALRKENQMKVLQDAFGITTAVEGQAFDRELQEQKRLDQIAEREARQKEKELRKKEEEKKREKAAKDQKKAIKAAEKARKGKNLGVQKAVSGRADAQNSHLGRYVAKSPEPRSSRPIPIDDRFEPREASAELEGHPSMARRSLTPEPSPHRVPRQEGGTKSKVLHRDTSPYYAQKRQRRDSPTQLTHRPTRAHEGGPSLDSFAPDSSVRRRSDKHREVSDGLRNSPVQDRRPPVYSKGHNVREAQKREERGSHTLDPHRSSEDGRNRRANGNRGRGAEEGFERRTREHDSREREKDGAGYRAHMHDIREYDRRTKGTLYESHGRNQRAEQDRDGNHVVNRNYRETKHQEARKERNSKDADGLYRRRGADRDRSFYDAKPPPLDRGNGTVRSTTSRQAFRRSPPSSLSRESTSDASTTSSSSTSDSSSESGSTDSDTSTNSSSQSLSSSD